VVADREVYRIANGSAGGGGTSNSIVSERHAQGTIALSRTQALEDGLVRTIGFVGWIKA